MGRAVVGKAQAEVSVVVLDLRCLCNYQNGWFSGFVLASSPTISIPISSTFPSASVYLNMKDATPAGDAAQK